MRYLQLTLGLKMIQEGCIEHENFACRLNDDQETIDVYPDDVQDFNLCCEILNLK